MSPMLRPNRRNSRETTMDNLTLEKPSLDLDRLQINLKTSVGPFDESGSTLNSSVSTTNTMSISTPTHSTTNEDHTKNTSTHDDSMKSLILSYKKRSKPMSDIKAPPKPQRTRSFKIDGVPFRISKEIEQKALMDRANRNKRRSKRESLGCASTKTTTNEHGDSFSNLFQSNPVITRRQRPKVGFLCLPEGHPLYWDKSKLSALQFSEEDRAYLAKTLKATPQTTLRGISLPEPTISTLKDLHTKEWNIATLGRVASTLFHPRKNPLDLSPPVAKYFYKRILSMKLDLEDEVEVSYKGRRYFLHHQEGEYPVTELMDSLREDYQEVTKRYDAYQQSTPYTIIASVCA